MVRFDGYTGFEVSSPAMIDVFEQIHDYAQQGQPLIIFGPSGAGKEYLARYYFAQYKKYTACEGEFFSLNCAGLSRELAQSEMFGHVKGAFSGADYHKEGLFKIAERGVLFLDEIGELDEHVQTMLLRAIGKGQGEGRRLGDVKNYKITDTVVICATERSKDVLREAFLYRLGFQIHVPGLDERHEDIKSAVSYFLKKAILKRRDHKKVLALITGIQENKVNDTSTDHSNAQKFIENLSSQLTPLVKLRKWPGNFRALRTAIDSGVIRAKEMSSDKAFIKDTVDYFNIHVGDYSAVPADSVTSVSHSASSPPDSDATMLWRDIVHKYFPNISESQKSKMVLFFTEYEDSVFTTNTFMNYTGHEQPRTPQLRLKLLANMGVLRLSKLKAYEYQVDEDYLRTAKGLHTSDFFPLPLKEFDNPWPEKCTEAADLIENIDGLFISNLNQQSREAFLLHLGNSLMPESNVLFYSFNKGSLEEMVEMCMNHLSESDQEGWYSRTLTIDTSLNERIIGASGYLNQMLPKHKKTILILDGMDQLKPEDAQLLIEKLICYWYPIRFVFGTDKQYETKKSSSLFDLMELTLQ